MAVIPKTIYAMALSVALVACGCASQPSNPPRTFSSVAIISNTELVKVAEVDSASERSNKGQKYGAVAGGTGGAAMGGYACAILGPWALACAAALAVAYATFGSIAGTAYRVAGMSDGDALYVNDALSRTAEAEDLQQALVNQLETTLPESVVKPPESAEAQVVVHLDSITVKQRSKDDVRVVTNGSMVLAWQDDAELRTTGQVEFEYQSDGATLDYWLADDAAPLQLAIREGIGWLAKEMASSLAEYHTEPDRLGSLP